MHASLTPKNNLILIGVYILLGAITLTFVQHRFLWMPIIVGSVIGVACGVCQLIAIRISARQLLDAANALEVRKALTNSPWGQAYIGVFWFGAVTLVALALILFWPDPPHVFASWLLGYLSLALMRDIVAFAGTSELARMEKD